MVYALKQLHSAGVYMYLDAAHAGRLGWPADLTPAAQLFAQVYRDAGSPAFVRGLATNVANYNALCQSSIIRDFSACSGSDISLCSCLEPRSGH